MWDLFSQQGDSEHWDALLAESQDANVFQSYRWGEHKRRSGWIPARWIGTDSANRIVAMVQVLAKPVVAGVRAGWAPGGPLILFPASSSGLGIADALEPLLERMQTTSRPCIRFASYVPSDPELAYAFERVCRRPICRLTSGYSVQMGLHQAPDVLLKQMTPKHRYYVKKALAHDLQWRAGNDHFLIETFNRLHADMVETKKLGSLARSPGELYALCNTMGQQAMIFAGFAAAEPISACLILIFRQRAFYFLAATGRTGREMGASYAMVYRLLEHLQTMSVTELDFGGVDPARSDAGGVNHFKLGFGGRLIEYLGEWEWARPRWLLWGLNLAVRYRHGSL